MRKVKPTIFQKAAEPFSVAPGKTTAQLLDELTRTSFQGRSLGQAAAIWREALANGVTIFLGLSGALVPAGFRKTVAFLIENRLIDVLVTTGANMFHDIHQSLGGAYYHCSPFADDKTLREHRFDRMYDIAASDREFEQVDAKISNFASTLDDRPCTTREFFWELGKTLSPEVEEDGIVTQAFKSNVPIYCPAIADSSFGLALGAARMKDNAKFHPPTSLEKNTFPKMRQVIGPERWGGQFDVIGDIVEMVNILDSSSHCSEIILGGGTPKNFIQQAAVMFDLLGRKGKNYKYCVQITTDAPHWGGLSGCTFEESTSWGKIHFEAQKVAVYCDATIGLPIVVQALADTQSWKLRPQMPVFKMEKTLEVTVQKNKVLVG